MLIGFIALYLLATLFIGWLASRRVKNTADFVVAGRNLPMFMAACALFATWFGSETVMGASSEFVEKGLFGVIEDPFGAALCLFLAGLLLAKPLYKLNLLTFGDFYKMRFGRKTELVASLFMIPSYFGWIAAQLVALGLVINIITELPVAFGIYLCAIVVMIYTYIGGMWAVSITDTIQTIIIIVGLVVLMAEVVMEAGGFGHIVRQTVQEKPDFFRFLPKLDAISILQYIAAWITLGLGSLPQQDIFQRVMAAKSERAAVRATYLSALMYLTIAFIPLVIGLCAKVLYSNEIVGEEAQLVIPKMVLMHHGIAMQVFFFGALLSAILSTTSGAILAPATVLGENIIRPFFKNISDKELLKIIRISIVAITLISCFMAQMKTNIYQLVGESSALSLVGLFMPLIAGLYWKKASEGGAILSMVGGTVVWIICNNWQTEVPAIIIGFCVNILGMVLGSYWFPHKVERLNLHS